MSNFGFGASDDDPDKKKDPDGSGNPAGFGFGLRVEFPVFGQTGFEFVALDGLQQVIEGIYFKSLQCIIVVSGGKHNGGCMIQFLQHFKTGLARHLNVQENKVNGLCVNHL